ncbi:hypothetical protein [Pseudarthrobacter sp. BIM B-2242]|uniref:hypothetical protein n=1 Tax=Pseudarthrobacter sp. BIM B-2242 TaxID=2772401 RepID=UPI00168A7512|nr:hypothetical protein [Pseudarthrobacter sp. BIM B-2242]QOD06133.1 hypothetical protein IDT60_21475 [Pseudarthrobacter sp. BIM B-2242]
MSTAPDIAPEGVTSILSKLAPSAFEMALDLSMSVGFEKFGERIDFVLSNADNEPSPTASDEFMALVAEHQDTLAERLRTARDLSRISGTDVGVPLEGLSSNPLWATFSLTAGPYIPDEADEDDEDDEDDLFDTDEDDQEAGE